MFKRAEKNDEGGGGMYKKNPPSNKKILWGIINNCLTLFQFLLVRLFDDKINKIKLNNCFTFEIYYYLC